MLKKLLPLVFLLAGVGAGAGAGLVLSSSKDGEALPTDEKMTAKNAKVTGKADAKSKDGADGKALTDHEYLKLTKQFVIPIVEADRIAGLVTMSLSLETVPGISEKFYDVEPKLRDVFLQVLFDHANMGGFDGAFTHSANMDHLRSALLKVAQAELGDDVAGVLIMSIARQDS